MNTKMSALTVDPGKQRLLLAALLVLNALAAMVYVAMPEGLRNVTAASGMPMPTMDIWQLALGNAAIILLGYGAIGLFGLWLAHSAGLPGIFRAGAGWRVLLLRPLLLGSATGAVLVVADLAGRATGGYAGFPHPPFPASLLASLTAGIGEELMFRLFVMSLWAILLGWLLRRVFPGRETRGWSLWAANGVAALAFAAFHLPTAMTLEAVATPALLPPLMLVELIVLNGLLGIVAGKAFARDGLIAASGVHFWADVVWHVVFGGIV